MRTKLFIAAISAALLVTGCGGSDSSSPTSSTPINIPQTGRDCAVLCIDSIAASKLVMLKNDSTNFTGSVLGTLASSASYSWSLGDGSTAKTTSAVSNYVYTEPDMYRVTLSVQAKDAQGLTISDSKTFQVNVLRARTVALNDTGILAIQNTGDVLSSGSLGSNKGSRLGRPLAQGELTRNFDFVQSTAATGRLSSIASFGECKDSFGWCPSFAIEGSTGQLWAAGNDDDSYTLAGTRSTGVFATTSPGVFDVSRTSAGTALNGIKYSTSSFTRGGSSYAVRQDGVAFAAGLNDEGQLSIGSNAARVNFFEQLRDTSGPATQIVQLAYGGRKVMVLKADGTLWAAGSNNPGLSGGLSVANSNVNSSPVLVPTKDNAGAVMSNVKSIETDINGAVYAIRWDGTLWVGGDNFGGRLGNGRAFGVDSNKGFEPALQSNGAALTGVASVAVTRHTNIGVTIAIKTDGSAWVAGPDAANFGALSSEVDADGYAVRFAQVRTSAGIVASNIAGVRIDTPDFAVFTQANGKVFVQGQGSAGGTFSPYATPSATTAGTVWQNAILSSTRQDMRYANWGNAAGTQSYDRTARVNTNAISFTMLAIDANIQAMRHAAVGDYCGYSMGVNGELYVGGSTDGNTCNWYATSAAMIPAFPGLLGATKTFLTGWE
jgi:hypothetical protein